MRERSVSAASSAVLPAARRKARDAGSEPARDGAVAYRKVTVSKMIPAAAATATALLSGRRLSPRLGMVFSASLEFVSQSNPDMAPQLTVRVHGVTHLPKVSDAYRDIEIDIDLMSKEVARVYACMCFPTRLHPFLLYFSMQDSTTVVTAARIRHCTPALSPACDI